MRPFRAPHHSASHIGLIGGGARPKPGEISLSHRGVLFLDEFPEFPRHVLEALRQPLEDGWVTISRASSSLTFPSKFSLVAAANPCPCGYLGDPKKVCNCSQVQIDKYQRRISGPIVDRIDLHVTVPAVQVEKLTSDKLAETSFEIRKRVQKAREIQQKRYKNLKSSHAKQISANSEIPNSKLKEYCALDEESKNLLKAVITSLNLSARSYTRVLKLSRTIADLEGEDYIKSRHLAEALQYRPQQES
jgi:magnesium chelatase family protein